MRHQIELDSDVLAPERMDHGVHEVAPHIGVVRCGIVNAVLCGYPGAGDRRWILVDSGVPGSAGRIRRAAEARFGEGRPYAIILTHGHFDHAGSVRTLL